MKLQDILSNRFMVYPVVAIISYFVFSNMWLLAMLLVVFDSVVLFNHYIDTNLEPKDYFHLALSLPLYLSIISFAMPTWVATIPAVCFAVKSTARFYENFDDKLNHTNRYDTSF